MEHLGDARVPGGGTLSLYRRGAQFTLRVRDTELMTSHAHQSEDALARLACAKLGHAPQPVILIGGLGMGYTLAAALKATGPAARIVVAELVPGVVEWNRGLLSHLAGDPLADPRVSVRLQDVALSLQTELAAFDAILLDVDNGPEGLTRFSNDWLYSADGLGAACSALRPNGVLAVWSATPDRGFAMRLRKLGFEVTEARVASSADVRDDRHTIWLAVNRASDG
ncbi:MAG: spermidine synthase [Elusimicrobia bacterium RBG_16_66_12]|nr:MAG: spermidine synthase [Elusimicrobia bacterium RBG_16_66_12]